ncbi:hypothetical protein ACIGXI_38695 [Kitasatospora aureofaciens]|uniref:hypothetical protein n=1 Tax=Kitasatospora aureofaciens TaxID=1894 RepID=UPI0037CC0CDB
MTGLESGIAWFLRAAGRYLVLFVLTMLVLPAMHPDTAFTYTEDVVLGGVLFGLLGVLPSLGWLAVLAPVRASRWTTVMAAAGLCAIGGFLALSLRIVHPLWPVVGIMGFQLLYALLLLPAPLVDVADGEDGLD